MPRRAVVSALALATGFALAALSASASTIAIPTVEITSLTHAYGTGHFGLEQTISDSAGFPCGSGVGTCSGPGFSAAITNGDTIAMRFEAPAGQRFDVLADPDMGVEQFQAWADWSTGASDLISVFSTPTVSFENLTGTAPTQLLADFGVGDAGQSVLAIWQGTVTNDFSFTALSIEFTVHNSPPGTLAAFGPVFSDAPGDSFSVGGNGPAGIPDQILMQLEPIPEPGPGLLLALGTALLTAGRKLRR